MGTKSPAMRKLYVWSQRQPVGLKAAAVGFCALILAAVIRVSPSLRKATSDLRLVDTSVLEEKQSPSRPFPSLDIKVRNVGDAPAFIKRVDVHVKKIWALDPLFWFTSRTESSMAYGVEVPLEGAPYRVTKGISQSVGSGEVDRFELEFFNDSALNVHKEYVFLVQLDLVYDEDDKSLLSGDLLFSTMVYGAGYAPWTITSPPPGRQGQLEVTKFYKKQRQSMLGNKRIAEELQELRVRTSRRLKRTLEVISQPQIPEQ